MVHTGPTPCHRQHGSAVTLGLLQPIDSIPCEKPWAHSTSSAISLNRNAGPIHDDQTASFISNIGPMHNSAQNPVMGPHVHIEHIPKMGPHGLSQQVRSKCTWAFSTTTYSLCDMGSGHTLYRSSLHQWLCKLCPPVASFA